jgi:hypothetical protein
MIVTVNSFTIRLNWSLNLNSLQLVIVFTFIWIFNWSLNLRSPPCVWTVTTLPYTVALRIAPGARSDLLDANPRVEQRLVWVCQGLRCVKWITKNIFSQGWQKTLPPIGWRLFHQWWRGFTTMPLKSLRKINLYSWAQTLYSISTVRKKFIQKRRNSWRMIKV